MKEKQQISQQELIALREVSLGKRLKWIIKKLKLTTKEFAKRCNLSYRTLLQYANDQRKPCSENLKTIAMAFSVNLHWLITGQGYPFVSSEDFLEREEELEEKRKEEKRKYYDEKREKGAYLYSLSPGWHYLKDLKEREKSIAEKREKRMVEELESELSFIRYCVEEVLSLPEEERYVKLLELIGDRYGVGFVFKNLKEVKTKKIEDVIDVLKVFYETSKLIKQVKKMIEE